MIEEMSPSAPRSVLVVDDERDVREFLRHWLESWGYSVALAENANDALWKMLAEPAPIMLIDIRMPGRDGLSLAEEVRAKWPQTAMIMATSVDDLATVTQSKRVGAIDYVLKPFGWESLRQALIRADHAISAAATIGEPTKGRIS